MRYARPVVLAIVLLATTAATALASGRVVLLPGDMYKPHAFPVSGDGDFYVRHLSWHTWGGKRAVASGQVIEQERPSHVNYYYPVRVTLSRRTYCASLGLTIYLKVTARIVGPDPGVFGSRTLGQVWSCDGTWRLTASDATAAAAQACSTSGLRPSGVTRSLTARGTSCATARRVVHEWFQQLKVPHNQCVVPDGQPGPAVCGVRGWRCISPHTVNGATYPVTCSSHAGRREVHFVNRV